MAGRVSTDIVGDTTAAPGHVVDGERPLLVKMAVAATFLACSWLIIGHYGAWKQVETAVSAWAMQIVSSRNAVAMPGNMIFLFSGNGRRVISALEVASECSVGYVTAFLLVAGSALVFFPRLSLKRILAAIGVAGSIMFAFNVLRIAMVGAMEVWLGTSRGYVIGHVYLGTGVTFFSTLLAGVGFIFMLVIRDKKNLGSQMDRI